MQLGPKQSTKWPRTTLRLHRWSFENAQSGKTMVILSWRVDGREWSLDATPHRLRCEIIPKMTVNPASMAASYMHGPQHRKVGIVQLFVCLPWPVMVKLEGTRGSHCGDVKCI